MGVTFNKEKDLSLGKKLFILLNPSISWKSHAGCVAKQLTAPWAVKANESVKWKVKHAFFILEIVLLLCFPTRGLRVLIVPKIITAYMQYPNIHTKWPAHTEMCEPASCGTVFKGLSWCHIGQF